MRYCNSAALLVSGVCLYAAPLFHPSPPLTPSYIVPVTVTSYHSCEVGHKRRVMVARRKAHINNQTPRGIRLLCLSPQIPSSTDTTDSPPLSAMAPLTDMAAENRRRMNAGDLYYPHQPDLVADRRRCRIACARLNAAGHDVSRRQALELWKE